MTTPDQKLFEEMRDAAAGAQAGRGDLPMRRLAAAIEAFATRCLTDHPDAPELEVTPDMLEEHAKDGPHTPTCPTCGQPLPAH